MENPYEKLADWIALIGSAIAYLIFAIVPAPWTGRSPGGATGSW
jgi:hypothetical protein